MSFYRRHYIGTCRIIHYLYTISTFYSTLVKNNTIILLARYEIILSKPHLVMERDGKSVRSWCDGSSDRSFMVDALSYFSFQPVLHDRCNKGRGMCYPVCGMVHIKEPLLLIGKSSPCGGIGFAFSLSEWSLTICLTPYNRR